MPVWWHCLGSRSLLRGHELAQAAGERPAIEATGPTGHVERRAAGDLLDVGLDAYRGDFREGDRGRVQVEAMPLARVRNDMPEHEALGAARRECCGLLGYGGVVDPHPQQ